MNLVLASVTTVKFPSVPVSVIVADELPAKMLAPAGGACQLGAEPEPLLVKI